MLRPIANAAARFDLDFVVTADRATIPLGPRSSYLTSSHGQLFDIRQSSVWPVLRDALLEAPVITISARRPKSEGAQPAAASADAGASYKIGNTGAADALKAIAARCERK
jgi:hypothetical protein